MNGKFWLRFPFYLASNKLLLNLNFESKIQFMNIHEYQAKSLLRQYGATVSEGRAVLHTALRNLDGGPVLVDGEALRPNLDRKELGSSLSLDMSKEPLPMPAKIKWV